MSSKDTGVVEAIALSAEQLGDSGSSGESDEEVLVTNSTVFQANEQTDKKPPAGLKDVVTVKDIVADEKKPVDTATINQIKPIEGPKVDPTMLQVMGVKPEEENVERDGQVPTIYDIDIDQLEEKPWRNADADITDWFNYGFTEDTWREYCKAQVRMRLHLYPHGKRSNIVSRPVPQPKEEKPSLNMKPVSRTGKSSRSQMYMKPEPRGRSGRGERSGRRPQKPRPVHNPAPYTPMPAPNVPSQFPKPANFPAPGGALPAVPNIQRLLGTGSGDLQSLLPNLASLPGMPKLPSVIEELLSGQKDKSSGGRRDRRSSRSKSRDRGRRRRRRRRSRSKERDRGRSRSKERSDRR